jgi:hypothetical protein
MRFCGFHGDKRIQNLFCVAQSEGHAIWIDADLGGSVSGGMLVPVGRFWVAEGTV